MNKKLTLSELQAEVDKWIATYGVRYFSELTNLGILMEEVGELSRHIVRKYGDQSYKSTDEKKDNPEEELCDILWVILCLSNQMGINLEEVFFKNLEKKTQRDLHRHTNNPKLKSPK